MTTRFACSIVILVFFILTGCSQPDTSRESVPDYRPTSTIKDIMESIIDPSADEIWESVATVVDLDGVHELHPETDDDWAAIRRSAIRLVEAGNLLLIPGRDVAHPDHASEYPDIELEPEEIQALIDQDQVQWTNLAYGLHDVATALVSAIDARDVDALMAGGGQLDLACEHCHVNYWYPNDSAARKLLEQDLRLREEETGVTP